MIYTPRPSPIIQPDNLLTCITFVWESKHQPCRGHVREMNPELPKNIVTELEQEIKTMSAGSKNNSKRKVAPGTVATQPTKQQKIDPKEKVKEGFARGLQAEKIIGIRKDPEKLFFLVKWKGTDDKDFVDAKEAKLKIPQVVIEFYEEKLNWFNDPEDSQDEEQEE